MEEVSSQSQYPHNHRIHFSGYDIIILYLIRFPNLLLLTLIYINMQTVNSLKQFKFVRYTYALIFFLFNLPYLVAVEMVKTC